METWYDENNTSDLVYSSDDDNKTGKGWYAQRWKDDLVTASYETKANLTGALGSDRVTWYAP